MNAIIIEQSSEQVSLAFELNRNIEIHRLRLARAKVSSTLADDAHTSRISVTFTFKSKAISAPPGVLRLEISFRMAGTRLEVTETNEQATDDRQETASPAILVECAYQVDYHLLDGFQVTDEQTRAFKDGNAIFNAWPYFREYLQNNLERMGLPPLTAPFLRLQPKAATAKRRKKD